MGIAIGAGTDIAIESADMILVKNDLRNVITAIDLSTVTFRRILINYVWASLYNLLGPFFSFFFLFFFFSSRSTPRKRES